MNASELAKKMLEYEEVQRKADELADQIKAAVLEMGKTQTVGNVRASYSKGRGRYDYEQAWANNGHDYPDIKLPQSITYDYTTACKKAGIDMDKYYFTTSGPTVSIKLTV